MKTPPTIKVALLTAGIVLASTAFQVNAADDKCGAATALKESPAGAEPLSAERYAELTGTKVEKIRITKLLIRNMRDETRLNVVLDDSGKVQSIFCE
ncbi:hypothetical protein [Pseudomonas sp.]|uniref:hypothetical protein n=1 Tax=Pseudomonas sp. TaxID=306 RepID=UPI002628B4B5|nr:hypothetical protein [Pseudomonas sp.]